MGSLSGCLLSFVVHPVYHLYCFEIRRTHSEFLSCVKHITRDQPGMHGISNHICNPQSTLVIRHDRNCRRRSSEVSEDLTFGRVTSEWGVCGVPFVILPMALETTPAVVRPVGARTSDRGTKHSTPDPSAKLGRESVPRVGIAFYHQAFLRQAPRSWSHELGAALRRKKFDAPLRASVRRSGPRAENRVAKSDEAHARKADGHAVQQLVQLSTTRCTRFSPETYRIQFEIV